jgi:hypothetical protein
MTYANKYLVCAFVLLSLLSEDCRRRTVLTEVQAQHRAVEVASEDAAQHGVDPGHVRLRQFDGSGKVVRWFFVFDSASDNYEIAILMDEDGGHVIHRKPQAGW